MKKATSVENKFLAVIAKAVYIVHNVEIVNDKTYVRTADLKGFYFDLLETDENGEPTQQAKACGMDTKLELNIRIAKCGNKYQASWFHKNGGTLCTRMQENPCDAIYIAACEKLDE